MPYIGNPIYQSAFVTDQFSGNGSTTAFTMSVAPAGTSNVLVIVSGVVQDPSTYSVVGNTLTFSAAPPSGTGNISCRYLGVPVTGVTSTAYRTVTEFTATASQTTFSPPSYTVGYINVYRNGVLLGSADYTATNGTTVVLATGATAGDLITTESFYVSSVLNAIPTTGGTISGNLFINGVETVGSGTPISGATNPIVVSTGNSNNYIQSYIVNNNSAGANASADFTAYPSNGADSAGWVDMGITGPNFSQAAYSVTGPNEAYLFGSAPSGASKTGNLVIATDSTGTANSIQFYVGGFNQSKSANKFTVSSTGAYGQLVSGTAQNTTSGTNVDFTGIPSWVKRITVMFNGVSTNGTTGFAIQIGSGSISNTGYISAASFNGSSNSGINSTSQFIVIFSTSSSNLSSGNVYLTTLGNNIWTMAGNLAYDASSPYTALSAGSKTLSGTLDRIRIVSTNGTDTFDAGSVNILYEG
jgi:hypothetical protein